MRHITSGASFAFFSSLVLWSCGGGGGAPSTPTSATPTPPTPTPTAATVTVSIMSSVGNGAFQPNPVLARSGDTVMFRNNSTDRHRIVMDDGSADLGDVAPGTTSQGFVLRNGNATTFHCLNHSSTVGSINGQTAPEPPPCPDPYGYGC